jgi:cobalt/nickel transport system permease protein
MTLLLDIPQGRCSPIHRLDPRWKLAGLLVSAVGVALLRSPLSALAALAGALLLVAAARLPVRWYAWRLAAALALPAFFALWLPLVPQEGDIFYTVGPVAVAIGGIMRAIALVAKAACIISLMLVVIATAPLQETFKAAQAMRVPGWLVQLVLMSYRYLHLLADEFARLRLALRVRGYRNRARLHSYRTIGQVAGTVLVRGHDRSDRVAQAMRCRGFAGQFHSLHNWGTRGADVLFFAMAVVATGAIIAWDVWQRW